MQRRSVVGTRSSLLWLLVLAVVLLLAGVAVAALVFLPQLRASQVEQARLAEVERRYQAGAAFERVEDWASAEGEYRRVVALDAGYKDVQERLAAVRDRLKTIAAEATAAAIAQAERQQADSRATATARVIEAAALSSAGATATADALDAHYRRAVGLVNMGQWPEAQAELRDIFDVAPDYRDVQHLLPTVNAEVSKLTPTVTPTPSRTATPTITLTPAISPTPSRTASPTRPPPTYTPYPTATPYPTYTPPPTPRPTVTPWKPLDESAIPAVFYYGLNVRRPPFDNPLVRQAFCFALDREAITKDVLAGKWPPASTFVHPTTLGRSLYGKVGCTYDPNRARELLAQAGYPNGKGLSEVLLLSSDAERPREIAEVTRKMWLAVLGVNVRPESMEWEVYLRTLRENPPPIYLLGWLADYNDPIDFLNVFHSGSPNNYAGFSNPDYDRLIDNAAVEPDKAKRAEMFIEAERILCETETVIIPLYFYQTTR